MRRAFLVPLLMLSLPASAWAQAPTTPSPGQLALQLSGTFHAGKQRIAFAGGTIGIRGVVTPAVAGEQVEVTIKRGRKTIRDKTVAVQDDGFQLSYRSHRGGTLTITAHHAASPNQVAMDAGPLKLSLVRPSVHRGGRGIVVRFMQQQLNALHYLVPTNGRYDGATGRAVLAYRKVNRMARTMSADRSILLRLAAGRGAFRPRYPDAGKHVEADLSRQVLALINPGGKVFKTVHMSSGKPSTPTVVGIFHFYMKEPGTNAKGMLDSNYFIRGYAIHGYPEVPKYAASHGCLRIPNANAPFVFRWVQIGDRIDVYR
ncbi:MAG TPA: L,D-transpeptidase [Solirubrobacteraceae bacterium]|nr:L,D-transpeptidase [Solirubrobacteraceae bacterium]